MKICFKNIGYQNRILEFTYNKESILELEISIWKLNDTIYIIIKKYNILIEIILGRIIILFPIDYISKIRTVSLKKLKTNKKIKIMILFVVELLFILQYISFFRFFFFF